MQNSPPFSNTLICPMPARQGVIQQCSTFNVTTTATNFAANETFSSSNVGGFVLSSIAGGTRFVSNPTGNALRITSNWTTRPFATDAELAVIVMEALNAEELKVVKIEDVKTPTGDVRTATNATGQPIQDKKEKVLIDSEPKKTNSGATIYQGCDNESIEYTNPDPMPVK